MDIAIKLLDAFRFLKSVKDGSVDLIITDPPYESMEKHRSKTSFLQKWFPIITNDRFNELFAEFYRILKNNSHLYLICDQETMFCIKPIGEQAGFKFWKPIIWDKVRIGMGYHYRARYECILFFEKGKRSVSDLSISDVLRIRRLDNGIGYPTQKPVELIEILMNQSSYYGDLICDPFVGSGTTAVACKRLGRKFIGCDISPEAVNISLNRLEDPKEYQIEMF